MFHVAKDIVRTRLEAKMKEQRSNYNNFQFFKRPSYNSDHTAGGYWTWADGMGRCFEPDSLMASFLW
jgi:hypothetical protein